MSQTGPITPQDWVECQRCHMPFRSEFIARDGACVICDEYRKKWAGRDYTQSEQELRRILEHYRRRHKHCRYDAIVAFSGGKDSTYVLYAAAKQYGLRPLAVTADNGLLTPYALENMRRTVAALGVDHVIVRRDPDELRRLYQAFYRKTKNFCEVCYMTIQHSLFQTAADEGVALVLTGIALKLDASYFRAAARYCLEGAFVDAVKDRVPAEVYGKYLSKDLRRRHRFHFLNLFDYLDYDEKAIYAAIEPLGWTRRAGGDKHADCRFHSMIGYLRHLGGDYSSAAFMGPAALLRDGQIAEPEFRAMVEHERRQFATVDPRARAEFLEYMGVGEDMLPSPPAAPSATHFKVSDLVGAALAPLKAGGTATEEDLLRRLVETIRPEVQRDGGDIRVLEYRGRVLRVEMLGACRACYMADIIMMRYLERLVRAHVSPDVIVENVQPLVD